MECKDDDRKQCRRCKMSLTLDNYIKKRDDTLQKTCNECLIKQRTYVELNKCPHSRRKTRCIECEGGAICIHKKVRSRCHLCGGGEMCVHGRETRQCKQCSNPLKVAVKTIIGGSKRKDLKYNRYDATNFIDKDFVESKLTEYTKCFYEDCNIELQLVDYTDNLATIERLDNSIGHVKENCVICCLRCNRSKRSNR